MAYAKKAAMTKAMMAPRVSKKEQKEILRLYETGGYTDKQIAGMVGHSEGKIGYWIRKQTGARRMVRIVKNPKSSVTPTVEQKTPKAKGYNLSENEKNLHPDVINRLHAAKSGDAFVQDYYKKFGFNTGATIHDLINMWSHRLVIFKFEEEKDAERRRHELLLLIKTAKKPVIEEPIKSDKRTTFADEGEQLVKINNRLSEMIAITKEILQVQKDTYILFKEKTGGGKKDDGNTEKPTTTPQI